MSRAALVSLALSDPPERWRELGFTVEDSRLRVGQVGIALGSPGTGIVGWRLDGLPADAPQIDGLAWSAPAGGDPSGWPAAHPNGAVGVDHVVVVSPDFDRTSAALERAGLGLRRVRDAGGFRQGFRRLGASILELVEAREADPDAPASFWGLVVVVSDIDALATRLGARLGAVKPAVQPGRRIATLRDSAGISTKLAFMDPD